jgi:hypothetical protein
VSANNNFNCSSFLFLAIITRILKLKRLVLVGLGLLMFKFENIVRFFGLVMSVFIGLVMMTATVDAAPPVCGNHNGVSGTCLNGLAQQLPDSQNPAKYNWTCTADGQTIDCSQGIVLCGNGDIDYGEECDGNNLNDATCADWNKTGDLACNASCKWDLSDCQNATCGDGKVEGLEQCELGVPVTQSCESQGSAYHSGTLTCDYATCNFNTDTCLSCGNGKKESYPGLLELCDGNDFGGKTCKDFGLPPFLNGNLKCTNACTKIDTSGCNRSLCGNGIIDGEEECDGNNLGVPPKSCQDLGCTGGGPVRCQDNCTFEKASCTGCAATGCTNVSTSPWSSPFQFRIPCCGSRDGQWADNLTESSTGLCAGGVSNFKKVYNYRDFLGWEWDCGDANNKCRAYKEPLCATEVVSQFETSNCSVNVTTDSSVIFKTKSAWEKAVADREAAGKDSRCDAGEDWLDSCAMMSANWAEPNGKNRGYTCRNTNAKGEQKLVRCVVGWAGKASCGTLNGQEYIADTLGNCAADTNVNSFLNLVNLQSAQGLCAPGTKVVKKGYYFGWDFNQPISEFPPYYGLVSKYLVRYKKWFGWQCQADDGRNGETVDCRATLNTDVCFGSKAVDAKCGPAQNGHFAYEGKGPTTGFCSFGKLGGRFEYEVSLNREKPATWSWYCLSEDEAGKNAYCSVVADVYCGDAHEGSYANANDVKRAGLCGGRHGVAKESVRSAGNSWLWSCMDSDDNNVVVQCKASNQKCGYADGRAYLASTFDANRAATNFLCQGNTNPTVSLSSTFPAKWTWSCGANQCAATLLECGWGGIENGSNYYTDQDFHSKGNSYTSFMCSNGLGAVRDWRQSNDLDGLDNQIPAGYDPGWFWSCEGSSVQPGGAKDKLAYGSCIARENKCGYFDDYYVAKSLFDSYKTQSAKKEYFCTYGYNLEMNNQSDGYSAWACVNPNKNTEKIYCSARHPVCGSASEAGKNYYKSSLEAKLDSNFGLLCAYMTAAVLPKTINAQGDKLSWLCGGSPELTSMTGLSQAEIGQTCSTVATACGSANGTRLGNLAAWNTCKNSDNGTCLCSVNAAADLRYPVMRRILLEEGWNWIYQATWKCKDSAGLAGNEQCSATCKNCN